MVQTRPGYNRIGQTKLNNKLTDSRLLTRIGNGTKDSYGLKKCGLTSSTSKFGLSAIRTNRGSRNIKKNNEKNNEKINKANYFNINIRNRLNFNAKYKSNQ